MTTNRAASIRARLKEHIEHIGTVGSVLTAHAFMVEAIARTVEQAELDDEFRRVAEERWTTVLDTGKTVPWEDGKTYLKARVFGG